MSETNSLAIRTPATKPFGAHGRLVACVAVAIIGAETLSSCSGGGALQTAASDGPQSTRAVSPASPSGGANRTERQRAGAAAVAQVVRYERLVDELSLHAELPLSRLYAVSTQPNVTDEIAFLGWFRSSGDRQVGRVRVMSVRIARVDLHHRRSGSSPTASVTACLDVSDVRAFGPQGRSIVPPKRKPHYVVHLQLVDRLYRHRRTWLIRKVSARGVRSCAD